MLDVMLPFVDGLDVCRILRSEGSDVPILLLTARVRALLRRSRATGAAARDELLRVGAVGLDTARFEVRVAGRPVARTSKESSLLIGSPVPRLVRRP